MINIDRNDYQGYFIDYFLGTLTLEETDALFDFLVRYPELEEEFNRYGDTYSNFPRKNVLKEIEDLSVRAWCKMGISYQVRKLPWYLKN
ncbi:MAG TPA: hypothetical protein VNZ86_12120 [Bacteroidia bacterium]|jgi:hypothetical protein|nr:hypothetical protein [Bacteroidia bacterium]